MSPITPGVTEASVLGEIRPRGDIHGWEEGTGARAGDATEAGIRGVTSMTRKIRYKRHEYDVSVTISKYF